MLPSLTPSPAQGKPKKLLEEVRDLMRLRHYSIRTERCYCDWITRFIRYHGKRHPREMAEVEVTAFLTHLAREGNVAASTQNQALSALLFLYKEVLKDRNRLTRWGRVRWIRRSNGGWFLNPAKNEAAGRPRLHRRK